MAAMGIDIGIVIGIDIGIDIGIRITAIRRLQMGYSIHISGRFKQAQMRPVWRGIAGQQQGELTGRGRRVWRGVALAKWNEAYACVIKCRKKTQQRGECTTRPWDAKPGEEAGKGDGGCYPHHSYRGEGGSGGLSVCVCLCLR